jgi:hypothetical protein
MNLQVDAPSLVDQQPNITITTLQLQVSLGEERAQRNWEQQVGF